MRLVVTGGRAYYNEPLIHGALERCDKEYGIGVLICGGATGVDTICEHWARRRGKEIVRMVPDWDAHGKAAGRIRNLAMILQGKPDRALVFPGGRGTAHMHSELMERGVPTEVVKDE